MGRTRATAFRARYAGSRYTGLVSRRLVLAVAVTVGAGCATAVRQPAGTCDPVDLGPVRVDRIAAWRDDARGAYSIIHDDVCGPEFAGVETLALPALDVRGLRAGLAAIAGQCEMFDKKAMLRAAAARGHEIVSHSHTHELVTVDNAPAEIAGARAVLQKLSGQRVDFYAFPYDQFTPATLALVEPAGYLGVRAGDRNDNDSTGNPPINGADPVGDYAIEFDVWPRTYSKYMLYSGVDLLNVHVWNAIEKGGWAVRELHSVMRDDDAPESHGFGVVPLSTYERHLDFLAAAQRAGRLWVDTPTAVLKYRHARKACRADAVEGGIRFDASNAECVRYATPISVVVSTRPDLPSLVAKQGGAPVPAVRLAPGVFSVTADPTRGDVALSGCARPAPAPAEVSLPGRPAPATSVCDVSRLSGRGGWWPLDDLERDEFEFHPDELPNWLWYPPAALIKRVRLEDGGTVLRYSGSALGAWSGAMYFFAGRDGAGACYDARAHAGVRFRMRGFVKSADDFADKVILSLVTADTRSRVYGGDLHGEGGNFHRVLSLTREWRMVEVPWVTFGPPTWGATRGFKTPALERVQGFDWAVTGAASQFEVELDDIELY
jgi:peptidoglycan/xylan/chitin deacetylase (PgdA/CDA1 family)